MNDKKRPLQPGRGAEPIPSFLRLSDVVEVTGLTCETRAAKAGSSQFLAQVSRSAGYGGARRRCSIVPGSPKPSRVWRQHVTAKENRGFPTHFPRGSALDCLHQRCRKSPEIRRRFAFLCAPHRFLPESRLEISMKSNELVGAPTASRRPGISSAREPKVPGRPRTSRARKPRGAPSQLTRRIRSLTTSASSTQVTSELNERI